MIEARAAGKELPKAKKAPARSKVVNLMDVLAQSLEASKKRRSGSGTANRLKRSDGKRRPLKLRLLRGEAEFYAEPSAEGLPAHIPRFIQGENQPP